MPIRFDEWIGFGADADRAAAGRAVRQPVPADERAALVRRLFTTVYATHFVTGLTIAAVLWVRNRVEWISGCAAT